MNRVFRETTPLSRGDCFWVTTRFKSEFDFPLHCHPEYELNFIRHAAGVQRVIGDHVGEADELELVLVGPELPHGWFAGRLHETPVEEITVQFPNGLLSDRFLGRNELCGIRNLLETASRGVLFSQSSAAGAMQRLRRLTPGGGFGAMLQLLAILFDLSADAGRHLLSDAAFSAPAAITYRSKRIRQTMELLDREYHRNLTLAEVAGMNHMTETAFSRFFKAHTRMTFLEALTERRLGHITRLLVETDLPVADIADACGFNNMSNFNRIFKRKKGFTPREFRSLYGRTAGPPG